MKKKRTIILINVFIIFLFITSCVTKENSRKIKIGYLPMVSSLTHFVALENGYYKEEGIEIEANPIKTSDLIAQDLVAGHIDAAIELSIVPLLKQNENAPNSTKIFSISSITSENGFDGILVKNDSQIKSLKDIEGKKVGVFPGSTAKNSFKQLFAKLYPTSKTPIFITVDPALHLQALEKGEIDAVFAYEPNLSIGIVKYNYKKIGTSIYASQYSPNPIGVGAINDRWLKENPTTAKAFFRAIDKAVIFIKKNPKKSREILSRATKLEMKVAEKINIMPMSLSNEIDKDNLLGYINILKSIGEINFQPKPEDICIEE